MLQNVLIQVQQQKVEMQRTMAVLDKLMRSNEVYMNIASVTLHAQYEVRSRVCPCDREPIHPP